MKGSAFSEAVKSGNDEIVSDNAMSSDSSSNACNQRVKLEHDPYFNYDFQVPCSQSLDSDNDDDDDSTLQNFITKAKKRRKSEIIPSNFKTLNHMLTSYPDECHILGDVSYLNSRSIFDLELESEICVFLDFTAESSVSTLENSIDPPLLGQGFPHEIKSCMNETVQEHIDELLPNIKSDDVDILYAEEEVPLYSAEFTKKIGRNLRKKRIAVSNIQKMVGVEKEVASEDDEDDWTLERWKQQFSFSMSKRKPTPERRGSPSTLIQNPILVKGTKRKETEQPSGIEHTMECNLNFQNLDFEGLLAMDETVHPKTFGEHTMECNLTSQNLDFEGLLAMNETVHPKAFGDSQNLNVSSPISDYNMESDISAPPLQLNLQEASLSLNEDILGIKEKVDKLADTSAVPINEEDPLHATETNHNIIVVVTKEACGDLNSTFSMPVSDCQKDAAVANDVSPPNGSLLMVDEGNHSRSSQQKNATKDGLLVRARNFISSEGLRELCRNMIHKPLKNASNCESDLGLAIDHSCTASEFPKQASADASNVPCSDADSVQIELSPNFNRLISQGHCALQQDKLSSKFRNALQKSSWCSASCMSKQEFVQGVTLSGSVSKLLSKRKVKFDSLEGEKVQATRGDNSVQRYQAADICESSPRLTDCSHLSDEITYTKVADSKINASETCMQVECSDTSELPTDSLQLFAPQYEFCSKHTSDLEVHSSCCFDRVHTGSPLSQELSPDPPTKFSLVLACSPSPPHNGTFEGSPDSPIKQSFLGRSEDPRPIRGILKQSLQHAVCNCVECQSVRSRAERAAKFSQQQLHDIQGLAGILMKELRSMRSLVEENLVQKFFVKNELEQVKLATSSAIEAESVAKKWLVKMVRDCNRYCKIQDTKKRKITFADEAGKQLCHVKHYQKNVNTQEHS
ncbi:hypothetical protein O6H91_05G119900 [Diphasiastrum complanatum]|uniref:Uncharacterized protein n=5 Tax=Diphasiastrum complanatum TaxID=34168 RepID=A0ACC2DSI8_DIPCM|nr:hypothetical protein O6H91_05G119900 [Diphasiastrum complanatum]KAJ7557277.1 hypothetical protein O6H91_05G119900 [Diphasiastrum complanatum]KAJ7557278.1 hypothetical protein O6H91_05G119900 [Diphasiastrum complanatum]KAJ7557279.1 hypothetical protein O6H91_05G119900 [Diphasiastrum complanatum]KAJ7557280.1 hypothetical protein O6H91_05G119900 [Diphasiastrum complanatum]